MQRLSAATLVGIFIILLSGCDSVAYERDGLQLTVVNQTTESWRIWNGENGDIYQHNFSGDTWSKHFQCYENDGCRTTIVFKPTSPPPEGCDGWEKKTETLRIPNDRPRDKKIELDAYDLDPIPRRCD